MIKVWRKNGSCVCREKNMGRRISIPCSNGKKRDDCFLKTKPESLVPIFGALRQRFRDCLTQSRLCQPPGARHKRRCQCHAAASVTFWQRRFKFTVKAFFNFSALPCWCYCRRCVVS